MPNSKVQSGILYVVPTPIGNNSDISQRSIEVLKNVDCIACEDTRVTEKLLFSLGFNKIPQLVSYHDHNERNQSLHLIKALEEGKNIALVSDAGTPQISDPGYRIVSTCYEKEITIIPLAGPSSISTALSICPIGGVSFLFLGFAPEKKTERVSVLKKSLPLADRIIFFEAPHRILKLLEDSVGLVQEKVFVVREMTKSFEEKKYDFVENLIEHFKAHPPKGEFVIIYPRQSLKLSLSELKSELETLIREGLKSSEIVQKVQSKTDLPRREVYDMITEIKHLIKKD